MSDHLIGTFIRRFLLEELIADRNLSPNTQKSYRDAIRLLLNFVAERYSIDPTRATVEQINAEVIRAFIAYLENDRGNLTATQNQRLASLHSLFRFIGRLVPDLLDHATQIQAIPFRSTNVPGIVYLEKNEINALLDVPDQSRVLGRRDYALLLFLYNTGARATEVAQLKIADLNLDDLSPSVRLFGKGRKIRLCPIWEHTTKTLRGILGLRIKNPGDSPVFLNVRGQPITRYGIYTLVAKTVDKAAKVVPSLQGKRISPHTIRHTTAVHLLRAGVDINTIRAWLGHVSLETTNRYAEVDLEMKALALEKCAVTVQGSVADRAPNWHTDRELMSFLASL